MVEVNIEKRLKLLQKEVGNKPKIEVGEFQNWAKTRYIDKLLCCSPTSLKEVQNVVTAAKKLKLRVRCTGAGHSWAPLFPDEGNVLMRVKDIKRHDGDQIELKKVDGRNHVTVMSGITVGELEEFELKHKVNLLCNVILTEPMYGGVVGAGCHGVGWDFNAIPDYLIRMRIVDSDGELRTFSLEEDPDMFRAIQTNLGLFGVIYDMTFDLPDQIVALAENDFDHKIGDLFYDPKYLKNLVMSNDSVEIFWWPYNSCDYFDAIEQLASIIGIHQTLTRKEWDPKKDETWVKRVNIQKEYDPKDLAKKCHYKWLDIRTWLESVGTNVADQFIVTFPEELTPLYCKTSFQYIKESNNETLLQPLPEAIHYRPNIAMMSVYDMEFCFRVKDDFSNITKAAQDVIEIVQDFAAKGEFPLNVAMEMRFMADSKAYLCPAHIGTKECGGSGHTVYIEVLSFTDTPHWKEFLDKIASRWKKLDPTIHWAKEWQVLKGGVDLMRKAYSKQSKKFVAQLDKAKVDPTGIFLNDALNDVVLPGRLYPIYSDPEEKKSQLVKPTKTCTVL